MNQVKSTATNYSVSTSFDFGQKIVLQYEIIRTEDLSCEEEELNSIFSLLIIKIDDGIATDTYFMYDVTRDEENAIEIINLLSRNAVTPCTAQYVLEDIL